MNSTATTHRTPRPTNRKLVLSKRQVEVMRGLCRGLGAKEIADELGLGVRTIEQHVQIAKSRLGARNATHAAVLFTLGKGS